MVIDLGERDESAQTEEEGSKSGAPELTIEEELKELIIELGASDYAVVYSPDEKATEKGQLFPDAKVILIHDTTREAAIDTLIHEYVEIQLEDVIRPYLLTINTQMKALEQIFYQGKEIAIKNLVKPIKIAYLREKKRKSENKE